MRTAVVPVEEIFELRWAVLRTGLPRETAIYPEDSRESTFHVAAYDDEGAVQACVTFFPDTLPGEGAAAYRFRGMGSAPEVRGQGYGAAVLQAGLAEATVRGAELVWCNGRTSAQGFYEHLGFTATGEEFIVEPSGPHFIFMIKTAG
ncbi:GNAT family N-acetyltransferase [Streptomyces sp. So13.3]|uniref:GNAT family N-acetyltransferase n=1 Tax=Streptomyces TaxID=1883 RepID=UPI001105ABE7|nr:MULTISPECIES: GNAT family N-acetyltransferase [Streptomyces]MCZ4096298.1 GNAT family N-acetyltransferase [Streptomyces sp. H39-C1]NEA71708.1 GNAT family N-acetyltransferase [Streptomyces sp. SID13588]QNA73296.1 GNAT family N-acetyltransferase [Streptomyces sp. So13.3]